MYKVGINFDEISDDLDIALETMRKCQTKYGEIRTLNQKSFVFWSDDEVEAYKRKIEAAGVELVAAATPLFKWYDKPEDEEVVHDNFGFNPRIDSDEKKRLINRTFEIAAELRIPRLRIFSCLGKVPNPGTVFAKDPLLDYALNLADKHSIDLYIENEPPCRIYKQEHLLELLALKPNNHLKLWFDIANSLEIGEKIEKPFIQQVAPRLGYIHIKDFVIEDGKRRHVPVGEGQVDYPAILSMIDQVMRGTDLVITVETHAKVEKVDASTKSLLAVKDIVSKLSGAAE